jgi:hypothetical protein
MKYKYFISYAYDKGFGNVEMITNYKIKNYMQIKSNQITISKKENIDGVIILYWKKIK